MSIFPYNCFKCGKGFKRSPDLQTHQKNCKFQRPGDYDPTDTTFVVAPEEYAYFCSRCGLGVYNAGQLDTHKLTCKPNRKRQVHKYFCQNCGKGFEHVIQIKRHGCMCDRIPLMAIPKELFKYYCHKCGEGFNSGRQHKPHVDTCVIDKKKRKYANFYCPKCGLGFPTVNEIQPHEAKCPWLTDAGLDRNRKAIVAAKAANAKIAAVRTAAKADEVKRVAREREHSERNAAEAAEEAANYESDNSSCETDVFSNESCSTTKSVRRKRADYACSVCDKPFASEELVMAHLMKEHVHSRSSDAYKCHECNRSFPTAQLLIEDMMAHLGHPYSLHALDGVLKTADYYVCNVCESSYKKASELRNHLIEEHNIPKTKQSKDLSDDPWGILRFKQGKPPKRVLYNYHRDNPAFFRDIAANNYNLANYYVNIVPEMNAFKNEMDIHPDSQQNTKTAFASKEEHLSQKAFQKADRARAKRNWESAMHELEDREKLDEALERVLAQVEKSRWERNKSLYLREPKDPPRSRKPLGAARTTKKPPSTYKSKSYRGIEPEFFEARKEIEKKLSKKREQEMRAREKKRKETPLERKDRLRLLNAERKAAGIATVERTETDLDMKKEVKRLERYDGGSSDDYDETQPYIELKTENPMRKKRKISPNKRKRG